MNRFHRLVGVPALIVLVGAGGAYWLARQEHAVRVPTKQAEQPAQPPVQPPIQEGAVFRSLDKLNAAAMAVGCPTVGLGDPATRVFDLAECLGEKAVAAKP